MKTSPELLPKREAAFLLHQITESLHNTILLVMTRYKPKAHDLKKLRQLVSSIDPKLLKVFPQGTAEERRLFELLRSAYVDARYKKIHHHSRRTHLASRPRQPP